MTEICKLCNKEFKQLPAHVKLKHGLSMEEYDEAEAVEEIIEEEVIEEESVEVVGIDIPDRLDTLLEEYDISEKELKQLLESYSAKHITIEKEVANLKDLTRVQTTKVLVAEILSKEHGFKVDKVMSPTGSKPKTWLLLK